MCLMYYIIHVMSSYLVKKVNIISRPESDSLNDDILEKQAKQKIEQQIRLVNNQQASLWTEQAKLGQMLREIMKLFTYSELN